VYAQALVRVDARLAERARQDAAVPPPPPSGKQADDAPVPKFDQTTCSIRPDYPRASLRYLETGKVTWAFLIGADGRLQDVRKLQSSGFADLDAAAILPFASCRARPAMVDGKPVAGWMPVQYVWTLD
jgi:TonB family protein